MAIVIMIIVQIIRVGGQFYVRLVGFEISLVAEVRILKLFIYRLYFHVIFF